MVELNDAKGALEADLRADRAECDRLRSENLALHQEKTSPQTRLLRALLMVRACHDRIATDADKKRAAAIARRKSAAFELDGAELPKPHTIKEAVRDLSSRAPAPAAGPPPQATPAPSRVREEEGWAAEGGEAAEGVCKDGGWDGGNKGLGGVGVGGEGGGGGIERELEDIIDTLNDHHHHHHRRSVWL